MRRFLRFAKITAAASVVLASSAAATGWQPLGLSGRQVMRLRLHQGRLLACTTTGLFAKSSAPADSAWAPLGFPGDWVSDVAVISHDTLLACRRFFVAGTPDSVSLVRSIDGGATWAAFQHGFRAVNGEPERLRVLVAFGPPLHALFGASTHIEKSTDAGETWRVVGDPILAYFIAATPGSPERLWVGGEGTAFSAVLLRSGDEGETWEPLVPVAAGDNACDGIAFDPLDPDAFVLGMERQLERSPDGGASWSLLTSPNPELFYPGVAMSPGPPVHLYAAGNGLPSPGEVRLYRSDDGGTSWTTLSYPADVGTGTQSLAFAYGNGCDTLFLGTQNGVYRFVSGPPVGVEPGTPPGRGPWLTSHPNPVRERVEIEFGLVGPEHVSVRIFDLQGRLEDVLFDDRRPAGAHRLTWLAAGRPAGLRLCELRTDSVVLRRKLLVVH